MTFGLADSCRDANRQAVCRSLALCGSAFAGAGCKIVCELRRSGCRAFVNDGRLVVASRVDMANAIWEGASHMPAAGHASCCDAMTRQSARARSCLGGRFRVPTPKRPRQWDAAFPALICSPLGVSGSRDSPKIVPKKIAIYALASIELTITGDPFRDRKKGRTKRV